MTTIKTNKVNELSFDDSISDELLEGFYDAIDDYSNDPLYLSGVLKDQFVHEANEAMKDLGINISELARKCGKSRQYLHKLFNSDSKRNYTIDTIVDIMAQLDRRVKIEYSVKSEQAYSESINYFRSLNKEDYIFHSGSFKINNDCSKDSDNSSADILLDEYEYEELSA